MTKRDLRLAGEELYSRGAICLADRLLLTLDGITLHPDWPTWDTFDTQGEYDGRRDWIAEINARIARGHPDAAYLVYLQQLLAMLVCLAAAAPQPEERHTAQPERLAVSRSTEAAQPINLPLLDSPLTT